MPETAAPKKAASKPRNRLPTFGRARRIRSSRPKKTVEQPKTFGDLVQSKMKGETKLDVPGAVIPRVNFLTPADRQLFMELAQTMREHTDTLREVHGLEPVDRSAPEPDAVEVEAAEEVEALGDLESEQEPAEASSDDDEEVIDDGAA